MKLYGAQNLSPETLLTLALERAYGLSSLPPLARTPLGKPYLPSCPHIHLNWSHSGPLILCALSDRPVGVDIAVLRPRGTSLPRYALTPEEYALYLELGGDWPAFYALWTRKEAWCKYTGEGLRPRWGEAPPSQGLCFGTYAGETWRAAVCGEEEAPREICWMEAP